MKVLGIDYGDAKVGLALGDLEGGIAAPFGIIKNLGWNHLGGELAKIVAKEGIGLVVVGLPVGRKVTPAVSHGRSQIQKVRDFIAQLTERLTVEVVSQDERLSTRQAKRLLQGAKGRDDDEVAAMLILQSYFDSLSAR